MELLSQEIKTPLIPMPEETKEQKLSRSDFEKIRKDYEQLQDELDRLKEQVVQAKDEKTKTNIEKKRKETQKEISASKHFARGNVAFELEDYPSAIQYYNQAIEINPKDAQAYGNRGVAYYTNGQISAAKRDFQNACDLGNDKACDALDKLR